MYNLRDAEAEIMIGRAIGTTVRLRITTSTNVLGTALDKGFYKMASTLDVHYVQGPAAIEAHVANTAFLPGGVVEYFAVEESSDQYIAGISDSGSGYIYITKKVK